MTQREEKFAETDFTVDLITEAMRNLKANDSFHDSGDKRLLCYDSEADYLIAFSALNEEDIIRIKPLPLS